MSYLWRSSMNMLNPKLKNRILKTLSLVTALVLCLAALSAQAQTAYRYDTAGVTLRGTLVRKVKHGPPGFGQSPSRDRKEAIYVLKLSAPISVRPLDDAKAKGSPNLDPADHVQEIQVFLEDGAKALKALSGKEVSATGTLNNAIAPSQYTKVWIDAVHVVETRAPQSE